MLVSMYKAYCLFDSSSQQSCYYLVNESEIDDFNVVRFKYIFTDRFYKIRMYKQISNRSYDVVGYCTVIREDINDLQLLDYNTFLQFYNLMREVLQAYIGEFTEPIQLDLDLILLNWDLS